MAHVGELEALRKQEAEAVEAEDFERAGALSAASDRLQIQLSQQQQALTAVEQTIASAVGFSANAFSISKTSRCF